jgi:hypothetical protein
VHHIYSRDDFLATYQDFKEYIAPILRGSSPGTPPNRSLPAALASYICWLPVEIKELVVGPQRSLFGKMSTLYSNLKAIDAPNAYELDKTFPYFLVCLDDTYLTAAELLSLITQFLRTAAKVELMAFKYASSAAQLIHALAFGKAFRNPEVVCPPNFFSHPNLAFIVVARLTSSQIVRVRHLLPPPRNSTPNPAHFTTRFCVTPSTSFPSHRIGGVSSSSRKGAGTPRYGFVSRLLRLVMRGRCAFAMYTSLYGKLLGVGARKIVEKGKSEKHVHVSGRSWRKILRRAALMLLTFCLARKGEAKALVELLSMIKVRIAR